MIGFLMALFWGHILSLYQSFKITQFFLSLLFLGSLALIPSTISRHNLVSFPILPQDVIAESLGTYIFVFAGCGAALIDKEKTLSVVGLAIVPGLALMAMIYAVGHVSGAHFNPAVTIAFAVYSSSSTSDLEAVLEFFNNELSGVAIGGILIFNILIAGSITGASMNPARSLGPAFVSGVYKNQWVYVVAPVLGTMSASLIYSLLRSSLPEIHKEDAKSIYNDLYLHPEA